MSKPREWTISLGQDGKLPPVVTPGTWTQVPVVEYSAYKSVRDEMAKVGQAWVKAIKERDALLAENLAECRLTEEMRRQRDEALAFSKDHEDDWKRIQDAERVLEAVTKERDEARSELEQMATAWKIEMECHGLVQRSCDAECAKSAKLIEALKEITSSKGFNGFAGVKEHLALNAIDEYDSLQFTSNYKPSATEPIPETASATNMEEAPKALAEHDSQFMNHESQNNVSTDKRYMSGEDVTDGLVSKPDYQAEPTNDASLLTTPTKSIPAPMRAINLFFNQDWLKGYPTGAEWTALLREARGILDDTIEAKETK